MAAPSVHNPSVSAEAKSKKKKGKASRTESPAPSASPAADKAASIAGNEGEDSENPYIRELQKNLRNVNKKLTNASKTDPLIAQHSDKSLDELVQQKIINADQKAQHLKKPQLQAQIAQLEEQLAQYKKVDQDYRARAAADKAEIEKTLSERFEKEKAEAIEEAKQKVEADGKKELHNSLLVLSQFLRLAAARRAEAPESGEDEDMALEGVLLQVYTGDDNAVATMTKLVQGSEEKTTTVNGDWLKTTFAQVKEEAVKNAVPLFPAENSEEAEAPVETTELVGTDLTIANAGLTEIDSGDAALTNGHGESAPSSAAPVANADVGDGAANAAAESQWDTGNDASLSMSAEWVEVPRDPAETETGVTATPAAPNNVQSWADEQPEQPAAGPTDGNDGFHQVQRNQRRGNEGGWRGRGRGEHRGRGWRGDGRGRGRGRGGNQRGSRREES